jgi:hypothetical protein
MNENDIASILRGLARQVPVPAPRMTDQVWRDEPFTPWEHDYNETVVGPGAFPNSRMREVNPYAAGDDPYARAWLRPNGGRGI